MVVSELLNAHKSRPKEMHMHLNIEYKEAIKAK
jgi:hypothetical protein